MKNSRNLYALTDILPVESKSEETGLHAAGGSTARGWMPTLADRPLFTEFNKARNQDEIKVTAI